MLTLLVVIKLWAEVALLALLGQWVLGLLVGTRREGNLVYLLLAVVSSPVTRLVARWAPRGMSEGKLGALAAALLGMLWLAATAGKVWLCLGLGVTVCR